MFGTFQQSNLRIEVDASASEIRDSLTRTRNLRRWMWPQQLPSGLPEQLSLGTVFTSQLGPVVVDHRVDALTDHSVRLLLHGGIDGFHEWHWGDGWLQSHLEGVSLLPLNLGQTMTLLRLRQFLSLDQENE